MHSLPRSFSPAERQGYLYAQAGAGCVFYELLPTDERLMRGLLVKLRQAYDRTRLEAGLPADEQVTRILEQLHAELENNDLSVILRPHVNHDLQSEGQSGALGWFDPAELVLSGRKAGATFVCGYSGSCRLGHGIATCHDRVDERLDGRSMLYGLLVTRRQWAQMMAAEEVEPQSQSSAGHHFVPGMELSIALFWEDILALVSRFEEFHPLIPYLSKVLR